MAVALFLGIGSRDFVVFAELLNQLVAGNLIRPGACFNVDPKALDEEEVEQYDGSAKTQSVSDFLLHIIPSGGGCVAGRAGLHDRYNDNPCRGHGAGIGH